VDASTEWLVLNDTEWLGVGTEWLSVGAEWLENVDELDDKKYWRKS
jgi:hypothetical protein